MMQFPKIKFCPTCGTSNLHPPYGTEAQREAEEKKRGMRFAECAKCHTHFWVCGFVEIAVIEDDDDGEEFDSMSPPIPGGVVTPRSYDPTAKEF